MKRFKKICKKTQEALIPYLVYQLQNKGYTEVIQADGYIYAKGDIPILLTAHMDTVHREQCRDIQTVLIQGQHRLSSPQGIGGDDRCGIYMILKLIETHKCSVLFCEDEEIGGIGSEKFCKSSFVSALSDLKYLIELDRANAKDAVFYDCDNPEFTKFITENTGYKETWGSFSDISNLAPSSKVAAVNFSCGYYNAHRTNEYVVWEEMINTIEVVKKLLDVECKQFEYIEATYKPTPFYGRSSYNHGSYGYSWSNIYSNQPIRDNIRYILTVMYPSSESVATLGTDILIGSSRDDCWGKFFIKHPTVCFNDVFDYEFDYQ